MAPQLVPVTFEYAAERQHQSVLIKGSWDRWQSFAALQPADDDPNLWHVRMMLSPGTVLFKFVVDNEWVFAPNYTHISDGLGGMNNVLHVNPPKGHAEPDSQENDQAAHHSMPSTPVTPPKSQSSTVEMTFEYPCDQPYEHVFVKGSWDEWEQSSPLQLSEDHSIWSAVIDLPAGNFLFKFVVDSKWTHCARYETQSDGFGGFNNVIRVPVSNPSVGNISAFVQDLDSVLLPEKSVPEGKALSGKEKEEEHEHPLEENSECEGVESTIDFTPPEAQQTTEDQDVAEPKDNTQTAHEQEPTEEHVPISVSSEKVNETKASLHVLEAEEKAELEKELIDERTYPSFNLDAPAKFEEKQPPLHVSEMKEKLELEEGSVDDENSPSDEPNAPGTEFTERVIEKLGSEVVNENHNHDKETSRLRLEYPVLIQDAYASSEEHIEADQAQSSKSDKLSDKVENLDEMMSEDERNDMNAKKNDRGCLIS